MQRGPRTSGITKAGLKIFTRSMDAASTGRFRHSTTKGKYRWDDRGVLYHRALWRQHHGPITRGVEIHHINKDVNSKGYDKIGNLKALRKKTHRALHKRAK